MQIQEQTSKPIEAGIQFEVRTSTKVNLNFPNAVEAHYAPKPTSKIPVAPMFQFVARTTLAERFPVLTCFAISCCLLATALITEIECLKGSGYFWR